MWEGLLAKPRIVAIRSRAARSGDRRNQPNFRQPRSTTHAQARTAPGRARRCARQYRERLGSVLSVAADHSGRTVPGRRRLRSHRTHCCRADADVAWATADRRKRRRRLRQHRCRAGRARRPRRLHAGQRPLGHPRDQWRHPQSAVRLADRLRAGRLARQRPAGDRCQEGHAGGGPQGFHRLAELTSGRGLDGDVGRRLGRACERHPFPEGDRHALSLRALSRHRADHAGPGGRTDRHDDHQHDRCDPAGARRHDQGLCRVDRPPRGGAARNPHRRRGRTCPATTPRCGTRSGRRQARPWR